MSMLQKERLPLTRRHIAEKALEMIEQDGVEAFSTRKLGKALGCEAMSIYHHFASKSHLLDTVAELLLEQVSFPNLQEVEGVEALRQVAYRYRDMAKRYPKAFVLLAARKFNTAGSLQFLEHLLQILRQQGYTPEQSLTRVRILGYFINGAILSEIAQAESGYQTAVTAEALKANGFQYVLEALPLIKPATLDTIFETGLSWLLESLQRID